ncbi:hypothetical protein RFI_22434 [Reticulomyxa filosa]|uniref:Uncharacterized protein n=1 Tax=Reticulomyxa filosa TaxID=46433 RepID=X6MPE5_RETFI|nr:hypothetical protein RFI_22434 [Reticulomyxa filosa]|eukprot:ETO14935.1 hypothetical protein RFI_22434 [Reticulomyxa filosa]
MKANGHKSKNGSHRTKKDKKSFSTERSEQIAQEDAEKEKKGPNEKDSGSTGNLTDFLKMEGTKDEEKMSQVCAEGAPTKKFKRALDDVGLSIISTNHDCSSTSTEGHWQDEAKQDASDNSAYPCSSDPQGPKECQSNSLHELPMPPVTVHTMSNSSKSEEAMADRLKRLTQKVVENMENEQMDTSASQELEYTAQMWLRCCWQDNDLSFMLIIGQAFLILASFYNRYSQTSTGENLSNRALDCANKALCCLKRCNELKTQSNNATPCSREDLDCHSNSSIESNHAVDMSLFGNDWGPYWVYVCEVYVFAGYLLLQQLQFVQSSHYFKIAFQLAKAGRSCIESTFGMNVIMAIEKMYSKQMDDALVLIANAIQGLGLTYYKMNDYSNAMQYANKLLKIIVSIHRRLPFCVYLCVRMTFASIGLSLNLENIINMYNIKAVSIEKNIKALIKDARGIFGNYSLELIAFHVSIGKMIAGLSKLESVQWHIDEIKAIRMNQHDQIKIMSGHLLIELIDVCLNQFKDNSQDKTISKTVSFFFCLFVCFVIFFYSN